MQILRGADRGQELGDATGGAEAKLGKRLVKKTTQAWPQRSQAQIWIGRARRGEKRKKLDKSEIGSESWELLAKQKKASERVLGEIRPEGSILGNGGIRQPRLSRPTSEAELVLASGGGRAPLD